MSSSWAAAASATRPLPRRPASKSAARSIPTRSKTPAARLIALYRRNGFNNTQVSVLEGNKPTDKGVVFIINEGSSQKIWKVEFEGNEFVTDGRLRTQIESKKPLMYIFKGYVDQEQIDGDVDRLTAYYRSFGYLPSQGRPQARIQREGQLGHAPLRRSTRARATRSATCPTSATKSLPIRRSKGA